MDRFSPVAPAAVRVMCLPVGSIGPAAFKTVTERLQSQCSVVALEQIVVPDDQDILLSPKVNPKGSLLLNYTTNATTAQEQQLSPYELFREPLIVLGLANGISEDAPEAQAQLKQATQYLRERHPRVVHRHLLLLQPAPHTLDLGDNVTIIRHEEAGDDESLLNDAICKVVARFLVEFSTYAKALQASPNVQTPGQTAKAIQKTMWLIGDDKKPASGSGAATPPHDTDLSSPLGEGSPRPLPRNVHSSPPPGSIGSPRSTSFDDIQRTALTRSDSNASRGSNGQGKRASGQDQLSTHGFGPELSKSKVKDRGKARVGIVIAHIHMMAGQWSEALRMLADHTNTARKLHDRLWHAKGLEGMVVSMLLLAWAHVGFSVPLLCQPGSEGEGSTKHRSKLSVNLGTDFWPADAAHQASLRRLSTSLPDLTNQIVSLYASSEGHLELPFVVLAEAKIRFSELLAVLLKVKGGLNDEALGHVVKHAPKLPCTVIVAAGSLSRSTVAALLAEAQPQYDDEISIIDHVQLLTGIYGVYAALGMDRKKGMILKDLVTILTVALIRARKLGAAEAGIHPAASLSVEPSVDTTLAAVHGAGGIDAMVDQIAEVFGIDLMPRQPSDGNDDQSARSITTWRPFGADLLKIELMGLLIAFYEAILDPHGVLRLESSFLRLCVPCAVLDRDRTPSENVIAREEQMSHAANIARTVQAYTSRGVGDTVADYWDPFLLRAVEFAVPDVNLNLILREQAASAKIKADDRVPGNPLLYDPNTKRTSIASPRKHILVRNERTECLLTLQNPLDFIVEIERIHLVSGANDSTRLTTEECVPVMLGPRHIQQVSVAVSPTSCGEFNIVGAKIKVASCRERFFPIFSGSWAASTDLLVKHQGQKTPEASQISKPGPTPIKSVVVAHAIPAMPLLEIEHTSAKQGSLMLLDGEHQELDVVVRNTGSACPAVIFNVVESHGVLHLRPVGDPESGPTHATDMVIFPGDSRKLSFVVKGISGVSNTQLDLLYGPSPTGKDDRFVRSLSVPFSVTVDATLQMHHAHVEDASEDSFTLSFDLANYWHNFLHYSTLVRNQEPLGDDAILGPGEVVRISMNVRRWSSEGEDLERLSKDLIRRIDVLWRTWDGARFGKVDLNNLALSHRQLELVRGPTYRMKMEVVAAVDEDLRVGSFVVVRASLRNDAQDASGALMVELRLSGGARQIASAGVLHRMLPAVPAKNEVTVDFVICPLMAGPVELQTVANEVTVNGDGKEKEKWHTEASLLLNVSEKSAVQ